MTTVLMTTDAVGGVWTYSLELARALSRRQVDVVLAIIGPGPSSSQRAELAASPIVAAHEIGLRLEWMDEPWADVDATGLALLDLADVVRPDLVHLNGYALAAMPWSVPTVVVAHSDVVSWWRAVHGAAAPAHWDEYRRRVRSGLDAASAVVGPTAAVLADLADSYGYEGGSVIFNARSDDWVRASVKERYVLSAGRMWDPAKNLAALEAVAPDLSWPVQVAGAGSEPTSPGSRNATVPGLHELGQLGFAEFAERLAQAAIYAAPARYEPFGLAALEAAQAGCALVLGDIPSLREVWGDAALFVRPDDHPALRQTLCELIEHDERRTEMAERARQRARRYERSSFGAAYADLYDTLIEVRTGVR